MKDSATDPLGLATALCHDDAIGSEAFGAVVPPIYQNSLFTFASWQAIDSAFDDKINNAIYTRGHNPTVVQAEQKLAQLAGADKAKLFGSGMAAIAAGILHFVRPGCHIICVRNAYGPTVRLLDDYLRSRIGLEVSFVGGEVDEIAAAIRPNTTLIYLESPSSGVFGLQDIAAIAALAKSRGIASMIDNTWATPVYQKALAMGVDLEVHSCSKYLGGHSDIVSGVLMGSAEIIDAITANEFELLGAKMAPMEAWFLLRSLRTLPLRLERHQASALKLAKYLESHPKVASVSYPGLVSHPQHALARQQMRGFTGLMAFRLASTDLDAIKGFVNGLKLFRIGVSWGGHESLIFAPAISYLKEMTPAQFEPMGLSLGDMRISVGLEDSEDLIADLEQALAYLA
ncbi:PLP-dependent aspartate aminotransferase family protein [Shewanella khirikhana]|uniref:trans-sulfuration enzyme family protein n=1 Tax=Shewanella khirikhana TaxID=1965282 RepID=UPI0030CF3304